MSSAAGGSWDAPAAPDSGRAPGLAVTALVLGCLGLLGLPLGPVALGLALAARKRSAEVSGMTMAAIVIGVLGTLLLAVEVILLVTVAAAAAHFNVVCLEMGGSCWR